MPRVKIDYVVSFSNEDPENQASNLLLWEVSKKKWLCSKGEPSCSVVLQLARAVKIASVQIGAHHAALVEVLVGRSESPNEPFQVLIPSCVFVSPAQSRGGGGGGGGERVRSFSGAALAAPAAQRWDRLRLVCTQPYNKHCKYGISFIHIFEPEGEAAPAPAPALPARVLGLDTFSSDEEDFRPGELFAKHRQSAGDTGAQIRRATSQALKNNPDAATKLMKTGCLAKNKPTAGSHRAEPEDRQRDKDNLIYTKDDDRPHAKIDHIVQRHKDENSKDEAKTPKPKEKVDKTPRSMEPSNSRNSESKRDGDKVDRKERDNRKETDKNGASSSAKRNESRKRPHSDRNRTENGTSLRSGGAEAEGEGEGEEDLQVGPESDRPLQGVVFALSGYQNPQRARLRDLALSLGAAHRQEWGPSCTHLICAFSRTPRLEAVRAAPGGARVPAPTALWLQHCAQRRRRLPWQWYAAEPQRRVPEPAQSAQPKQPGDHDADECDTDDEIEKVRRERKRARPSPSRDPRGSPLPQPARPESDDSDEVEFVKDERMQGNITVEDSEGDTDAEGAAPPGSSPGPVLPALLAGRTFVLDPELTAPLDAQLLGRYCIAYGGLVLAPSEVEEDAASDYYVLCGSAAPTRRLRQPPLARARRLLAHWVWACHTRAALAPLDDYLLTA